METRERILECALEVFYDRGYDGVGVQEIVDRSGITKPTLYYYFGSKRGLLECLVEERCKPFRSDLLEAADYQGDLPETLYRVAKACFDFGTRNRKVYFFMLALYYSARGSEAYQVARPWIIKQHLLVTGVFESAKNELGNMNGRQVQFASGFIGIINHHLMLLAESGKEDLIIGEETIRSIVHQFMYGIYS